ncbi:cysteine proteinase [Cristinia sonorae]|uniref:Ubiquitin carboxyl-terminal hydrolase n=1 Tax=Cristinia sonorae TaxID=1940300 RepID=A0A8K0UR57_9AGAR|nr:cysteine proteinase [Cristinia sonorae]
MSHSHDQFVGSMNQCIHIHALLSQPEQKERFLRNYRSLASWSSRRSHTSHHAHKRRKIAFPTCGTCDATLSRPFVCLQCTFSGCWNSSHIQLHLTREGHEFCADVKSGSIFCNACDDFIYNSDINATYDATILSFEENHTYFQIAKKAREPFKPWLPTARDTDALDGTIALSCQGRRGFLNLGQTCYLNVILQSFVANPLLRNYFLSDKHNHRLCSKAKDCACCEMDKLFSEVYSGNEVPFGPISFLSTTWRASSDLSGYAQQDAHECFISTLNQVHAGSRGSTKLSCICIVHSTFDGLLQSEVRCERCNNVTTTTDPMLDISLELKGKGGDSSNEFTLAQCLRRFTQPEKLGAYHCVKCSKTTPANKRLSIRKLPPVLSFQFKRFEHKTMDRNTAHKIEATVRFPSSINMAEYTTLVMNSRGGPGKHGRETEGSEDSYPGPHAQYDYELFSVVCHDGQIDNGHYTCFTRYQDEWYHFDDDKVTHSSLGRCLKSQAYMCFYVKRHLDYKPYVTPSYVVAREAEAVKEREREKEAALMREQDLDDALLATV